MNYLTEDKFKAAAEEIANQPTYDGGLTIHYHISPAFIESILRKHASQDGAESFLEFQQRERRERLSRTQDAYEKDRAEYIAAESKVGGLNFVMLLKAAQQIVEASPNFKRFIDGTPLANDIAVWMAEYAQAVSLRYKGELEELRAAARIRLDSLKTDIQEKDAVINRLTLAATKLVGYAQSVRTDRKNETGDMCYQTVDWCQGLLDYANELDARLTQKEAQDAK